MKEPVFWYFELAWIYLDTFIAVHTLSRARRRSRYWSGRTRLGSFSGWDPECLGYVRNERVIWKILFAEDKVGISMVVGWVGWCLKHEEITVV